MEAARFLEGGWRRSGSPNITVRISRHQENGKEGSGARKCWANITVGMRAGLARPDKDQSVGMPKRCEQVIRAGRPEIVCVRR